MPQSATHPAQLVDLDALARNETQLVRWTPPAVVDGHVVTHRYRSPLGPDLMGRFPTCLRGGIVTDPAEIAAIRRRVQAHAAGRGAWRRTLRKIRGGR